MEPLHLTKLQARKIILNAAGLARYAQFGFGIEAVFKFINHLGFVQVDTNYVVERAHHHAIFARVPDYEIIWLTELCEEGRVFEYFTSESGYLPMHDFRFSLPVKQAFGQRYQEMSRQEQNLMQQIMDRVEREGALKVGDFENDRIAASNGWWDWRPAKVALERLYFKGELMISRDRKFHKFYDLALNLVPQETNLNMPSAQEYARYIIKRTLAALGICSVKEMAWRARRVKGNMIKTELLQMVEEGLVELVNVEGVKGPLYILGRQDIDIEISDHVFILSPFDILNIFRHRLKDFFAFDYQIECFVPAAKRQYGYFSLPVLAGDTFIARMDAKADRKQKLMIVHNLHFEEIDINTTVIEKFIEALKAFTQFNQCHNIVFKRSNKPSYLNLITDAFSD